MVINDIKEMSNSMIEKYGIDVIHISFSKKLKCSCAYLREGKSNCPKCFGTGKVAGYKVKRIIPDNLRELDTVLNSKIGQEDDYRQRLYSKSGFNINDIIIFAGWKNNIATNIINIYKAGTTMEARYIHGELSCNLTNVISCEVLAPMYKPFLKKHRVHLIKNREGWKIIE